MKREEINRSEMNAIYASISENTKLYVQAMAKIHDTERVIGSMLSESSQDDIANAFMALETCLYKHLGEVIMDSLADTDYKVL